MNTAHAIAVPIMPSLSAPTPKIYTGHDFPVALQKVYTADGQEIPRARTIVRTDTNKPLSVVSDRYFLREHPEILSMAQPFIKELGKNTSKIYVERDGARMIAEYTFEHISHAITRQVGDTVALRLSVINSYNSTTAVIFRLCGMVLRCLNGMTVPGGFFDLRFRHTEKEELVLPSPDLVMSSFHKAGETWKTWAHTQVPLDLRKEIIQRSQLLQILSKKSYNKSTADFLGAETAWDLYNSFTYAISHELQAQQSGKLSRFDRLNGLFEMALKPSLVA